MKGPNLAGDCLQAQQLIACVPEPLPTSAPQTLRRFAAATGALASEKLSCLWESMKAMVAFSHSDSSLHGRNLGFDCLNALCPVQAQQECA